MNTISLAYVFLLNRYGKVRQIDVSHYICATYFAEPDMDGRFAEVRRLTQGTALTCRSTR